MTESVQVPEAPAYLPEKQKEEWRKRYREAFFEAKTDYPDDAQAQRITALKEANKLLRVPVPQSAADLLKLEAHHVLVRGEREINGVKHVYAVTSDGKKHLFPITKKG